MLNGPLYFDLLQRLHTDYRLFSASYIIIIIVTMRNLASNELLLRSDAMKERVNHVYKVQLSSVVKHNIEFNFSQCFGYIQISFILN